MKNILKTTLLVITSLAIAVLMSEGLIRLLAPQRLDANLVAMYEPDDHVVFKLKKGYSAVSANFEFEVPVETNSIGLRDKEIGPKPPGRIRLLGLGDSFSFANGVTLEDTYFKRLEQCLTAKSIQPIEVLNCAVPANSLVQEIRYLKKYGIGLQPDGVLVGFYVGNDFVDSYELFDKDGTPLIYVHNGSLRTKKVYDVESNVIRVWSAPVRRFFQTRSHFYIFVRNRSSEILSRMGLRAPIPPPEFCAIEYSERMQNGWAMTQSLLKELSAFTREQGLRLYVVILPAIYQVYRDSWDQYVTVNKIDPGQYDLEKPQRLLAEFCAENDIECIDVLPALRRAGGTQSLFFPVDSHMNPAGHATVADSLCAYLSARLRQPA